MGDLSDVFAVSALRPLAGTSRAAFRVYMKPEAEFLAMVDVRGKTEGPADADDTTRRELFSVTALSDSTGVITTGTGSASANNASQQESGTSDFSLSLDPHDDPDGAYFDISIVGSASVVAAKIKVGAILSHVSEDDIKVVAL